MCHYLLGVLVLESELLVLETALLISESNLLFSDSVFEDYLTWACLLLLHSRCAQRNQTGHLTCLPQLTCHGSLSICFLTGGLATIHFIRPARLDDWLTCSRSSIIVLHQVGSPWKLTRHLSFSNYSSSIYWTDLFLSWDRCPRFQFRNLLSFGSLGVWICFIMHLDGFVSSCIVLPLVAFSSLALFLHLARSGSLSVLGYVCPYYCWYGYWKK